MTILRIGGVIAATTIAALCFTDIGHNLVAAPLNMESEAEHGVERAMLRPPQSPMNSPNVNHRPSLEKKWTPMRQRRNNQT